MYSGIKLNWGKWEPDETGRRESKLCIASGVLTRDAETVCINKPCVKFGIKWRRKEFLNCVLWEGNPFFDIASRLETGDNVFICGVETHTRYLTKSGEEKDYYDMEVSFLIPASIITDVNGYQSMFNAAAAPSDKIEAEEKTEKKKRPSPNSYEGFIEETEESGDALPF